MKVNKIFLALTMVVLTMLAACTQDNVHEAETDIIVDINEETEDQETFADSLRYEGNLTSSVPTMLDLMTPVTSPNFMELKDRTDKQSGYATLVLGAFDISVAAVNLDVHIGEMAIDSVQYASYPDGSTVFFKNNFETMAGSYLTKGSLSGKVSADGEITMTMNYKPGAMPFDCESVFEGQQVNAY